MGDGDADNSTRAMQEWVLRHTEATCPSCSAPQAAWITDEFSVYTPYARKPIEGIGPDFLTFTCGHCGYTRFHAVRILETLVH